MDKHDIILRGEKTTVQDTETSYLLINSLSQSFHILAFKKSSPQ